MVNEALREHGAVGEDGVVCKRVERNNLEKHSAERTEQVQNAARAGDNENQDTAQTHKSSD